MSRVKRSVSGKKKRRKIFKLAKGFFGARSRLLRTASEAVDRAMKYAYRDRRVRKREFRSLWIARINAGARINDLSYSRLIDGLKKACVEIDRKVLSDIAIHDPRAFSQIVSVAKGEASVC
ncbi:MAG: 50S ribosomal protein L20 [Smithellaceae bacterium]|nr:50S ribosomal protein L20 [Smithellaceae bacterium]